MRFVGTLLLAAVFGLVLVQSASALRFTDESYFVPEGVVGDDYSHRFEGDGGCGLPYQFRVLSGGLPPGLSLTSDGELVGIPTQAGSWSFWVELSDEDPPSERWCLPRKSERSFTVHVIAPPVITTASAPPATLGTPYSLGLGAEGGSGTRAWSIGSGRLPPGLTLDSPTGAITGSPTAVGVYRFRVRLSDGSRSGSKQFTVAVREPLAVQTPTVPRAEVGIPIQPLKLAATGGSAAKTWQLDGVLPDGLGFDTRNAEITGTPSTPGSFPVKLLVGDSEGRSASVELTILVSPGLAIGATRLEPARIGRPYRTTIRASGGVGHTRFTLVSGRLPTGIRLDASAGTLLGRPRSAGTYRVVIGARDALGATARRAFVLTVRGPVESRQK